MLELDEIKKIINESFDFRLNHLYNSLNSTSTKSDLHFKQKAIDKLEKICRDVIKKVEERWNEKTDKMLNDMEREQNCQRK